MISIVVSELTLPFVAFVEKELSIIASVKRIERVIREALFDSRWLWESLTMGLVTEREVAVALVGYLHTAPGEKSAKHSGDSNESKWLSLIDEAEQIIRRNLEKERARNM